MIGYRKDVCSAQTIPNAHKRKNSSPHKRYSIGCNSVGTKKPSLSETSVSMVPALSEIESAQAEQSKYWLDTAGSPQPKHADTTYAHGKLFAGP